jgi:hypothetical protein
MLPVPLRVLRAIAMLVVLDTGGPAAEACTSAVAGTQDKQAARATGESLPRHAVKLSCAEQYGWQDVRK